MKAISPPKTVLQMLPGTLPPGLFLHPRGARTKGGDGQFAP